MGKDICTYIKNLNCTTELINIMTVEHRSNNPKRDFLFCNKLQGKHIPVSPSVSFDLFDELAYQVDTRLKSKKVLVIGFAETATAIGAYIASHINSTVYSLQTTREECTPVQRLIEFSEEHSHATEQFLYGDINVMPDFNYVLFVEDEISTGKTILNFITEFKKVKRGLKFGVASICNWQSKENKEVYKANEIDTFALITGELTDTSLKMDVSIVESNQGFAGKATYSMPNLCKIEEIHAKTYNPFLLERTGRLPHSLDYNTIIEEAFNKTKEFIGDAKDILVLGTEEFMYFPMVLGEMIESFGKQVKCHATTRSSIDIIEGSRDLENELVNKSMLHSAYDSARNTYVYNLRKYDKVLVVTDSNMTEEFIYDITSALYAHGNSEIDIMILNIKQ